jgi:hypothetical protein
MKYIITAKEMAIGVSNDDIASPLKVTEIATELVITRLACLMMLKDNKISKNDTIVTNSDRFCLYENVFDNVVSWKEFCSMDVDKSSVIDLLSHLVFPNLHLKNNKNQKIPYLPFYKHWERDKEEITNINFGDLSSYDLDHEFVALVIRTRAAWPEKNLPEDYWKNLIKKLSDRGKKVLVFGKETDVYANENTQHVSTFKDWCGIVNHPNCESVISTITGGVYPVFVCGNPKLKLIIIDNLDLVKIYGNDPSWYNECINFTKIQKIILNFKPSAEQLMEIIA